MTTCPHGRPENVCEHGNLARKCESCELLRADAKLESLRAEYAEHIQICSGSTREEFGRLVAERDEARAQLAKVTEERDEARRLQLHHQSAHSVQCNKTREMQAERDAARARCDALQYSLRIFIHAHETGNSVPPNLEAQARAALASAGKEGA